MNKYQTFGERVLLPTSYVSAKGIDKLKLDTRPALFSFIADTADVVVCLLTKHALGLFPRAQRVSLKY